MCLYIESSKSVCNVLKKCTKIVRVFRIGKPNLDHAAEHESDATDRSRSEKSIRSSISPHDLKDHHCCVYHVMPTRTNSPAVCLMWYVHDGHIPRWRISRWLVLFAMDDGSFMSIGQIRMQCMHLDINSLILLNSLGYAGGRSTVVLNSGVSAAVARHQRMAVERQHTHDTDRKSVV